MRFLCLHGIGTSSQVLETQTATIRYELDGHHTFEFVEGTIPHPIAPEIKAYYPPTETYYTYYITTSATSMSTALAQLATYIATEGPFDAILGYSMGAALAATYLIQHSQDHPTSPLPFQCAIFFSGGRPMDPAALKRGELKLLEPAEEEGTGTGTGTGPLLRLPTAHVWGGNDALWPGTSEVLCRLCEEGGRSVFVHEEGHDVPGARAKEAVQGSVRVIRRTVDRALMVQ